MAVDTKETTTKDLFEGDATALSAGAALAAKRRVVERTCEVCGKTFHATVRAKYCSNKCKQAKKNAGKKP